MRLIKSICVFCILLSVFISCADTSTNLVKSVQANLYQVGGCQSHGFPKASSTADTSFSYRFTDTLIVDFWAYGNCYPDSNRYSISYNIKSDTIFVTAIDTAINGANCFCRYVIQTEFVNLPLEHYVFSGIVYENNVIWPDYIEDVYKNGGH